jgi:hypothetical protein
VKNIIGIALNMEIAFGRMTIFTMLILAIHELGRSFHLLMSSLISFFSGLYFSLKRSLVFLVKFIPRYFLRLF